MKTIYIILAILASFFTACTEKNTYITGPDDWQPPVLEWLSPPEAEVRGTVGIDIDITDSSSISWARLYVDGVLVSELTAAPYRFELISDSLLDGVHILETRAQDAFGNLGISPILRINVANSLAQNPQLIWVPDDYSLIQAAINASTDFDTIRVRDGIYYETLNLFGKGIWIESENGPMGCTVNGNYWHETIFVPPSETRLTIRGFTITAGYFVIFIDDGAQINLFNNIIAEDYPADSSNYLLTSGSIAGSFRNNLFTGSRTALQVFTFLGDLQNNIIQEAWNYGLWNRGRGENPILHHYNIFWQNGANYFGFTPGIGEFDANPLIDLENGQLFPDSPCIDSGDPTLFDLDNTRSDIGPFGGPWAYN